jgi:hypothetical protein
LEKKLNELRVEIETLQESGRFHEKQFEIQKLSAEREDASSKKKILELEENKESLSKTVANLTEEIEKRKIDQQKMVN